MWWVALLLPAAAMTPIDGISGFDPALIRLLDRTVWIDIGVGRTAGQLSPKEMAALKLCKEPSMGFETTTGRIVQTFYAGMALRTDYASASMQSDRPGKTIVLFLPGNPHPAETLHLLKDGSMLVQETPGFRPHTFVKCTFHSPPAHDK
jgi:hypothetical protein